MHITLCGRVSDKKCFTRPKTTFSGLKTRRLEVTSLRKNFKSPHIYDLFQFLSALSTLFERFA